MKANSLETTDIFRGAFFLCKGGDLSEIRFRNNGSRIATFLIRGKGLNKLDKAYRNGQALVNPLQFRESLNHLRDILFEELRKNEGRYETAKQIKLLNRVIEFYHTAFCEDPRAKEYLIKRGITNNAVFADLKVGLANGTLLNTLPGESDIFEQLQRIGVLTEKGNEKKNMHRLTN